MVSVPESRLLPKSWTYRQHSSQTLGIKLVSHPDSKPIRTTTTIGVDQLNKVRKRLEAVPEKDLEKWVVELERIMDKKRKDGVSSPSKACRTDFVIHRGVGRYDVTEDHGRRRIFDTWAVVSNWYSFPTLFFCLFEIGHELLKLLPLLQRFPGGVGFDGVAVAIPVTNRQAQGFDRQIEQPGPFRRFSGQLTGDRLRDGQLEPIAR